MTGPATCDATVAAHSMKRKGRCKEGAVEPYLRSERAALRCGEGLALLAGLRRLSLPTSVGRSLSRSLHAHQPCLHICLVCIDGQHDQPQVSFAGCRACISLGKLQDILSPFDKQTHTRPQPPPSPIMGTKKNMDSCHLWEIIMGDLSSHLAKHMYEETPQNV